MYISKMIIYILFVSFSIFVLNMCLYRKRSVPGGACHNRTRSRSDRNVADARLERTSPSTDVPLGSFM